ncbi:PorV/PorQ family protein, partial [bacterium]|nr:PorV/PorQ family protein [bacterium]
MQIIRKIVILGLFLGFTQPVSAEPGSTGAAFLKIGIGARALGMGGAFVGIADDVSALYWNPAGVSQLSQKEVLFAHNALSQDIGQSFLGYVHPLRKRNIGVGLNGLTVGGIEGRENEHSSPENLEAKFSAIILNYSQKVTSNLRIGLNGKVIADNLDGDKQKAFALDLGLLYPRGSLTIGASLNNLGSQLGGADLPTEIKVGLAYRLLKDKLTLVASLDGGEQTRFHLGGEYLLFDRFALRGGLCANDGQSDLGEGTGLSLGLGVRFSSFKLDYALLPYGDMGSTHRISLGAKFGDGETGKARKPFMRAKEGRTKRIAILNFANDTGKLEFDWLIKTIPNLLTTELANSAYLAIIDPDRVEKLIKEGLDEEEIAGKIKTDILVKGSFAISGKTFRIDAKAIDAESSVLLVACSVEGSANKLFDLVYDLAWQLDRKLFLKLNPGVEEASYKPPVGVGKALAHLPDLSIEKVEIANIFPSKYNYYADNPIGKIILKNNTSQNFSNVKVRINIPKFMGLPSEVQVNEVLANSTKEVPLKVALDNDRLLEINENTPTPVEIKAIYYKQGKEEEIALTKSVVFFDRNSIDWDNPASLAAFATPKDDVVKTFSRKVLGSVRIEETGLPVRILQAAAIFEAL